MPRAEAAALGKRGNGQTSVVYPRREPFVSRKDARYFKAVHDQFFNFKAPLAAFLRSIARLLGRRAAGKLAVQLLEDPVKSSFKFRVGSYVNTLHLRPRDGRSLLAISSRKMIPHADAITDFFTAA
jgi:hypothetical protein